MNQLSGEISKGIGAEATQDKALGRVLKLGLDVHYRQVTVAMQEVEAGSRRPAKWA